MNRCLVVWLVAVAVAVAVSMGRAIAGVGPGGGEGLSDFERDRRAILSMAGGFAVTFRFEETLGVAAGYELREPEESGGHELVVVIEDRGDFISLQHLLVVEGADGSGGVVKHWRQDWAFEDAEVLAFRGDRTWERETRGPVEVEGAWTQAVYQTDDGPRYEAVGRWRHLGERSMWESEVTWRPLPRREHTKRDDYGVVVCRNRHTVTPAGWYHEQDNHKTVLDGEGRAAGVVAHEVGLNSYIRLSEGEARERFESARAYWAEHAAGWAEVRAAWAEAMRPARFRLREEVGGRRVHEEVFGALGDAGARAGLAGVLRGYVEAVGEPRAAIRSIEAK